MNIVVNRVPSISVIKWLYTIVNAAWQLATKGYTPLIFSLTYLVRASRCAWIYLFINFREYCVAFLFLRTCICLFVGVTVVHVVWFILASECILYLDVISQVFIIKCIILVLFLLWKMSLTIVSILTTRRWSFLSYIRSLLSYFMCLRYILLFQCIGCIHCKINYLNMALYGVRR